MPLRALLPLALLLGALLVGLLLGGASPAEADPGAAPRAAARLAAGKPASEERMALYQKLAAVNYCVARGAGLPDERALPLAAQTIAVILRNEHDGRIARVGQDSLPPETLLRGSAELTLLGARQLCPESVPEEVRAKLEEIAAAPPS